MSVKPSYPDHYKNTQNRVIKGWDYLQLVLMLKENMKNLRLKSRDDEDYTDSEGIVSLLITRLQYYKLGQRESRFQDIQNTLKQCRETPSCVSRIIDQIPMDLLILNSSNTVARSDQTQRPKMRVTWKNSAIDSVKSVKSVKSTNSQKR